MRLQRAPKELEDRSRKENRQLLIETFYRNAAMLEALAQSLQCANIDLCSNRSEFESETITTLTATEWKQRLQSNQAPDFHKTKVFYFCAVNFERVSYSKPA